METELEKFMRGLTRKQAAWLLGVTLVTILNWQKNGGPGSGVGKAALTFFASMAKGTQEQMKEVARKVCPNQGGKVY